MTSKSPQNQEPIAPSVSSPLQYRTRADEPPVQGWPILIVDDDESILLISKMVLSRVTVLGKPLQLSLARSGQQARELAAQRTFAAAIVDVVMETDTAGLDFIAWLRDQPHGRATRVVVRTGQPGLAPEEEVLRTYEINDYWSKTELSARRIRTAMTGMIRSYHDLMVVEQQRRDVSDILIALPGLLSQRSATRLLHALANTTGHLFGTLNTVLMFIELNDTALEHAQVIASTEEDLTERGLPLQERLSAHELALLEESEQQGRMVARDHSVALLLRTGSGRGVALLGRGWSGHEHWRHDLTDILVRNSLVFLESLLAQAAHYHALERQLRHDEHTGLPNRRGLMEALDKGWQERAYQALMLVHLVRLRSINEAYGQEVGDEALLVATRRLKTLEGEAFVARLDGGTFALALHTGAGEVESFVARVVQLFDVPFELERVKVFAPVFVGVTLLDAPGALSSLHHAELALKDARRKNLHPWTFYEPSLAAVDVRNALLLAELHHVWQTDELLVHYQPIVSLNGRHILGAEALLRWNSARFGLLSPLEFIPLAERSGLITRITLRVLHQALKALDLWQSFSQTLYVSVNVSPLSLLEPDFVKQVLEVLGDRDPSGLRLEITENERLSSDEHCQQRMQELRARGIRFIVDDFGTGYSSLSYLNRLPFEALKIDRSFVHQLTEGVQDAHRRLLEAMLGVANALQLMVTAEGIETEEQAQLLEGLGCPQGQGFLFGRPAPEAELTMRLQKLSPP